MFSPKLDEHGNSVKGVDIFEQLSRDMGLHLMESTPVAQTIVQRRYSPDQNPQIIVYELVGSLQFAEAEMLLRRLQQEEIGSNTFIFDLNNLSWIHAVGQRMLLEAVDRLNTDGHQVILVDPDQLMPSTITHQGRQVKVYTTVEHCLSQLS